MILHRYISMRILIWTLLCCSGIIAIVWITQALRLIEFLINSGASLQDFFTLSVFSTMRGLFIILPTATVIATMIVLNRMQYDREITILSTSGLSNLTIMRGPILVGGLVSFFLYINSLFLLPVLAHNYKSLQFDLRTANPVVLLQEGVFTDIAEGLTVFIREKQGQYQFNNIFVSDQRKADTIVEVTAERGYIDLFQTPPQLIFLGGIRSEIRTTDNQATLLSFERHSLQLWDDNALNTGRAITPDELPVSTLLASTDKQQVAEGHFRIASPLMGLAMAIIGGVAILYRQYARPTNVLMIVLGGSIAIIAQVAIIVGRGITINHPELYLLQYACPLIPIVMGLMLMWQTAHRHKMVRT